MSGLDDSECEYERADTEHQLREYARELCQFDLQRCEFFLSLRDGIGDLAHLCRHARACYYCLSSAVYHGASHVDHVASVGERYVLCACSELECLACLGDRHRLSGQRSLLDLHRGFLYDAAVGRYAVACFKYYNIAHDELTALDAHYLAVAQHFRLCGGHLLERFDSLFGLILLNYSEHGVENYDEQDNEYIRRILMLIQRCDQREHCRRKQDYDHRVLHLIEEPCDAAPLLCFY